MIQGDEISVGTKVWTDTHGVYQDTEESLSRLSGTIVNADDKPWNIHVKLDGKDWDPVGFSYFELYPHPITEYHNEEDESNE